MAAVMALLFIALPAVVRAEADVTANTPAPSSCAQSPCTIRLTPPQLLASVERLVHANKFEEARALLAALKMAPGFTMQTRFLTGFMAAQEGDFATAAREYKAILADDPGQTRVRLELGRAMLALGQSQAADRQLRLAQQSRELGPDIARLVRGARDVIRSSKSFRADVSLGIAPDSNINNATDARTVNVRLGDLELPLTLNDDARAKSGTGQTGTLSLASRLPVGGDTFFIGNLDGSGTNYAGTRYDDYLAQVAAGADTQVSNAASVSLQAIGAQRWFGGRVASRQVGARLGAQLAVDEVRRVGVQLDVRRTTAAFDPAFTGWQGGLYVSYETSVSRTMLASTQVFARRDWLHATAYSNVELGANATVAGELPHGVSYSFGGTVSHARFDTPLEIFSAAPRRDWRLVSQATLGYRKVRVFGFSPQVSWQATVVGSSLDYFRSRRSRFSFSLARYF
jgi:hypothetical protein